MKRYLSLLMFLTLAACSDDGASGADDCGPGEVFDSTAGECGRPAKDAGVDSSVDMGTATGDMLVDGLGADQGTGGSGPDFPVEPCGVVSSGCDDGVTCTTDTCVDDVCEHVGGECGWPAERQTDATNLTAIDRPGFGEDLSGVVYNPVNPRLWLVRNNGPSRVWSLVRDGAGEWQIDTQGGNRALWSDFGDAEGIAMADWNNEFQVLVLREGGGVILEFDFSDFSKKTELNAWQIPEILGSGAEGLTFVPDAALSAGGFVDQDGQLYTSTQGMGGLVFVAHQREGSIHVVDLNRANNTYVYVGQYATSADESSGLEWDGSTGQLYVWHDSDIDQIEVLRLSSSAGATMRKFDTIVRYDGPRTGLGVSRNFEGIAVEPVDNCVDGRRNFYMTTDGGGGFSFFMYGDFSC